VSKMDQILLKMQTAQSLRWEDAQLDPFHPGATRLAGNLARRLRGAAERAAGGR
jgi:hypothetical protein